MATGQYDDAWETPGWTAQNLAYPPDDTVVTPPPAGLKKVELTGSFWGQSGKGAHGSLHFRPSISILEMDESDSVVNLHSFRAPVNKGKLKVYLLSPDGSVVIDPASWYWEITGRIGSAKVKKYLPVPQVGETVDWTSLSNNPPVGG